jgi:hypothetical protein
MRLVRGLIIASLALAFAGVATATPFVSFDVAHAQGANYYYLHFYVNQVLGNVFSVTGDHDVIVTHLGAFDMNPDNEPYWDPDNPVHAIDGFAFHHAVALFDRPTMTKLAEVVLPAGTAAPIQDEGFRYLALAEPVTLQPGHTYVLAAWWSADDIEDGGMDTFYLLGTAPDQIPTPVVVHDGLTITDGCFNPNAGDGSTVDPPFIFNMFWGLYAGGANFLVQDAVATEPTTWGAVKSLFQ